MALTGNPQNMIIGALSGLAYGRFFVLMLPIGLLGLGLNYWLLLLLYRKTFQGAASVLMEPGQTNALKPKSLSHQVLDRQQDPDPLQKRKRGLGPLGWIEEDSEKTLILFSRICIF